MLLEIHPNDHRFTHTAHKQNQQNYPMLAMPKAELAHLKF
jgi:hypothetical protein